MFFFPMISRFRVEKIFKKIEENKLAEVLKFFKEASQRIAEMDVNHWQCWNNLWQEKID